MQINACVGIGEPPTSVVPFIQKFSHEEVVVLMDGGRVAVDITGRQNDMTSFETKDDILTMLIHMGYLGYDSETGEAFIPNKEVLQVYKTSTRSREWAVTFRALENSQKLLEATWKGGRSCNRIKEAI